MKTKNISVVIILLGLGAIAYWWFGKSALVTSMPGKTTGTLLVPQTAAPNSSRALAFASSPIPAGATPSPAAIVDPHLELTTAIADIVHMLESGDFAGLSEQYLPPDQRAQISAEQEMQQRQQMQQAMQDPRAKEQIQMLTGIFQSLEGQKPILNDAGNRATCQVVVPAGALPSGRSSTSLVHFIKIDGRWYLEDGRLF